MSHFSERLERDLQHIADRATPSPTAWAAIQTRIAEQADQPELEIIVLKPNPKPNPPTRMLLLTAAAAVLVVGGLYLTLSGGEDSLVRTTDTVDNPTPSTTPASTTPAVAETSDSPTSTTTTTSQTTTTAGPVELDRVEIEGTIDVDLVDGELIVGSGTGSFQVTTGAEALGCSSGTIIETYKFQRTATKVLTCTSGARTGTFTIDAGGGFPNVIGPDGTWEVIDATGDFVGLTGNGPYLGRDILLDEVNFPNPIYIFEPVSDYSDSMTGVIEFE